MFCSSRLLTLKIFLAAYCKFSLNVRDCTYLGLFVMKHSNPWRYSRMIYQEYCKHFSIIILRNKLEYNVSPLPSVTWLKLKC